MLSRTADHLFWMARYMERAENTARMLNVSYETSLLPQSADMAESGWRGLLSISELTPFFHQKHDEVNARNVMDFMVRDESNLSSIWHCLRAARENARAVRGTLTTEVWETQNQTWLEFNRLLKSGDFERDPAELFEWVKFRSHLSRGVTVGTMLMDESLHFLRIGTFLERADNTARLLDVKFHALTSQADFFGPQSSGQQPLHGPATPLELDFYHWAAVLRSVSGFEIYRKVYRNVIRPERVAELLILRPDMPRSLAACINEVQANLRQVANDQSGETLRKAGRLSADLQFGRIDEILATGLHAYLTQFLDRVNDLGAGIGRDFLVPVARVNTAAAAAIDAVLRRHGGQRAALVQILREVQAHTRWLPREVLAAVADGVGLTPAIIEGVAGFYRFFHLQPVGRVHLLFSDNVTDRHAGSRALAARLCERLGVAPGQVSADGAVSVGFTSCSGLGDQGPAALVNQHQVLTRLDDDRIDELAARLLAGEPPAAWPAAWHQVLPQIRQAGPLLASPPLLGEALRAALARGAEATLAELAASGLRGRGGAGFDTARKWALCRAAPVPDGGTRVVVCNADEGEPGTFKDRVLLSEQADAVVEGMTVAAHVLGARQGLVYLRGEYRFLLEHLEAVLARRRAAGLLGPDILGVEGFEFDIAIHLGAGAYVCGEESALIESLEGKRGVPRIRPPFPVEQGYQGQPTVVNNVETFAAAAHIARQGGAWWAGLGVPGSAGTKIHSVSGDCARPGVYEFPFGVTVAEILAAAGARDTQMVQVGGPSGLALAAGEYARRIAFDDVPSAGAFMVFDATRDPFEIAHGFAEFFAHESCGFCTPCRVGTELVKRRFDKLARGHGSVFDERELRALESLLHGTTHCGLGATATNPLRDTLQRFPAAYARRLQGPRFVPGFDLDAELAPARRVTGRDDAGAHLPQEG